MPLDPCQSNLMYKGKAESIPEQSPFVIISVLVKVYHDLKVEAIVSTKISFYDQIIGIKEELHQETWLYCT